MGNDTCTARSTAVRLVLVGALSLLFAALSFYLHVWRQSDVVHSHIAYIPIILAGVWWGRKCLIVAGILAAAIIVFHLLGVGAEGVLPEIGRAFFFIVVALCIGTLGASVKQSQHALRISEQKHRLLIDKSLAGIFVYRNEQILFVNPRLCEMLACSAEALVGVSIWEFFHEQDLPRVKALVLKRKAEGFSDLRYEARLLSRRGGTLWADILSSVADYEGGPAVLVNAYDITARKQFEQKQRDLSDLARKQEEQLIHSTRLAELGEMAAGVAHELNQPLSGIRNFARNALYMIEEKAGTSEDVRANLRMISEQVDRAAKIINQMRSLARKTDRHMASIDINSTIRESVEFLMPQFQLASLEVTLDLAPDLPSAMGDRTRMEQVILNLLTNARQAMEESSVRHLRVRTYKSSDPLRPITVEISDTGKGFTADQAAKLFRPFFTTKKTGQGTGLGLSISLSIIKDHNGTITAEGAPDKGATFTIRLPLTLDTQPDDVAC